jgi:hypothetical protein
MDKELLTKLCTKCQQELPLTQFFKRSEKRKTDRRKYKNGPATFYRSNCKKCTRQTTRAYDDKVRIYMTEYLRSYRIKNAAMFMLASAKNRAKKLGRECTIKLEDVVVPEFCPILGIRMEKQAYKAQDNSPSLDRIDSNQGYIKGNVQVISRRANMLKSNATLEEIERLYLWMKDQTTSNKQNLSGV